MHPPTTSTTVGQYEAANMECHVGTFFKEFAGKVIGSFFVAVCLALGFGPDK